LTACHSCHRVAILSLCPLFGPLIAVPTLLDIGVVRDSPVCCSAKAIASKILLDQIIMAPIGTCLFYIVTSVLQGETQQVPSKLREKFIPTLIASYTLWPAAHAINFKFVPSSQRILYTNIVSVCLYAHLSAPAALHNLVVSLQKLLVSLQVHVLLLVNARQAGLQFTALPILLVCQGRLGICMLLKS